MQSTLWSGLRRRTASAPPRCTGIWPTPSAGVPSPRTTLAACEPKNWRGRSFCTRNALIRCIRENVTLQADEDPGLIEAAVARIETFLEMHVHRSEPLAGVELDGELDLDQRETAERDVA